MLDTLTLSANQALLQSVMSQRTNRCALAYSEGAAPSRILSSGNVAISTFCKQINIMYTALGELPDTQMRQSAREGMRALVQTLASENNSTKIVSFNHRLSELKSIAPQTFRQLFVTAYRVDTEELNPRQWLDAFLELDNRQLEQGFLDASNSIIFKGDAADVKDLFAQFLDTTAQLEGYDAGEDARIDTMSRFFQELQNQQTRAGQRQTMTAFISPEDASVSSIKVISASEPSPSFFAGGFALASGEN
ncbi:MAG: hypothetical protein JXR76_11720 [Deltaproteobacteria bacterium]|nr:hypothetical protein [Deltaproteobacteria bacterium]